MPRKSVFDMSLSSVYGALLQKAQRKGRTKEELDTVIFWLTGHDVNALDPDMTYGDFFRTAPAYNPRAELITGRICGIQVESIEDPLLKQVRQLDKLVDELAKGRPLEKVLR